MKKLILLSVLFTLIFSSCTENPFFTVALEIPYDTTYTVRKDDQVNGQLILETDEESYDAFVTTVETELANNNIEGDYTATIKAMSISIDEAVALDWTILGDVEIEFVVDGSPSNLFDAVTFPTDSSKTIHVGLPVGGFSLNEFMSYETAYLKVIGNLNEDLTEDVPLNIHFDVEVGN